MGVIEVLENKIFLIVLEKILLGAVVLFVGYKFSKFLENYKLREALRIDLAKDKLSKINELWSMMAEDQAYILGGLGEAARLAIIDDELDRTEWEKQAKLYVKNCQAKVNIFQKKLNSNKYWLGSETYSEIISHYNNLNGFVDSIHALEIPEIGEKMSKFRDNAPSYGKIVSKHFGIDVNKL